MAVLLVTGGLIANANQAIQVTDGIFGATSKETFNWALFSPWAVGGVLAAVIPWAAAFICRAIAATSEVEPASDSE